MTTQPVSTTATPSVELQQRLLSRNLDLSEAEAEQVAESFDGILVSMLLKEMRTTLNGEGLFGSGPGADTYGQLFDQFLGDHIARSGGIGVGQQLTRYMQASQT